MNSRKKDLDARSNVKPPAQRLRIIGTGTMSRHGRRLTPRACRSARGRGSRCVDSNGLESGEGRAFRGFVEARGSSGREDAANYRRDRAAGRGREAMRMRRGRAATLQDGPGIGASGSPASSTGRNSRRGHSLAWPARYSLQHGARRPWPAAGRSSRKSHRSCGTCNTGSARRRPRRRPGPRDCRCPDLSPPSQDGQEHQRW